MEARGGSQKKNRPHQKKRNVGDVVANKKQIVETNISLREAPGSLSDQGRRNLYSSRVQGMNPSTICPSLFLLQFCIIVPSEARAPLRKAFLPIHRPFFTFANTNTRT
jgi:hypothetical protein